MVHFLTIKLIQMRVLKLISFFALLGVVFMSFALKKETAEVVKPVEIKIEKKSFAEFLSHFEKVDLPFAYEVKDMGYEGVRPKKKVIKASQEKGTVGLGHSFAYDFVPEFKWTSFGRMGPPTLVPIARFYPNEKMVAIVYTTRSRFDGGLHKNIRMVCYDLKGNILGHDEEDYWKFNDLGLASVDETKTFRIDENRYIWRNNYANIWKEEVKMSGVRGNEIEEFYLTGTEVFKINEDGQMEKLTEYPSTTRASK